MTASLAQLVEHALRKRMVVGSIPTGGFLANKRNKNAEARDQTGDLQIFGLTLSQLSYRGLIKW